MPRVSPSALRQAHRVSAHAARLLPVCRDVASARNEARWIREHVTQTQAQAQAQYVRAPPPRMRKDVDEHAKACNEFDEPRQAHEIEQLVRRRARGEPLQYVLGTQPFGVLDMKCRPGVLIPRPEPEAYTTHLANLIRQDGAALLLPPPPRGDAGQRRRLKSLRILDLCTGTGCIALLLHALLASSVPNLTVCGVDISPKAVALARENLRYNARRLGATTKKGTTSFRPGHRCPEFIQGDIFSDDVLETLSTQTSPKGSSTTAGSENHHQQSKQPTSSSSSSEAAWDILICNPPYISPEDFTRHTARSVQHYEPIVALVPPTATATSYSPARGIHTLLPQDVFYARLLDMATKLRPRIMLFEVGDLAQAKRVATMALQHKALRRWVRAVEIWRDWPDVVSPDKNDKGGKDEDQEPVFVVTQEEKKGGKTKTKVRIRGSGRGRSVFIQCHKFK